MKQFPPSAVVGASISTQRRVLQHPPFERIALLHLDQTALPQPLIDPDLEKRPAYQEGSLTETPDLSRYDE